MKYFTLTFLVYLSSVIMVHSQQIDTIYFAEDDSSTDGPNYEYYRIYIKSDSLIHIKEFDKRNKLYYSYYESGSTYEKTGPSYNYDNRQRITHLQIYKPSKYPDILNQFDEQFKYLKPLSDTFSLNVFYRKDGGIKSIGYMSPNCLFQGSWLFYLRSRRNEYPTYLVDYLDGQFHGRDIYFDRNGIPAASGMREYGKKHGLWEYSHDGNVFTIIYYLEGKKMKKIR